MARTLASSLLVAFVLPACSVYGPSIFDDIDGGGSTTGGGNGDGGNLSGGTGGGTGGVEPSGGSGGTPGGTGGGSETGGSDTGGADTGGSGGIPGVTESLITDFSAASFFNDPFAGGYDRYVEPDGVWPATKPNMREELPDEPGNFALHVQANTLDEWGAGVFISLNQPGGTGVMSFLDLAERGFTGIKFRAKRVGVAEGLVVALEDGLSRPDPLTLEHSKSAQPTTLTESWQTFTLPFSSFLRDPDPELETAYAVHFSLNPVPEGQSEVDIWIDDLRAYTAD